MPIIVTGGNGFIGSNFIEYMLASERTDMIINFDKKTSISSDWISERWMRSENYDEQLIDINDINDIMLESGTVDFLVHFAAESHVDNSLNNVDPFIKTNVNGTLAVAKFCHEKKIKMIHISTDEVYGHVEHPHSTPFDVHDALEPRNPYAASKAAAELMLEAFANTVDGFEYVIIRPSNNYGPHQDDTKFIPKMMKFIASGESFPIYGFGDFYREWTHVLDTSMILADIIAHSFESGRKINISSKEMLSNFEMYKLVLNSFRACDPDIVGKIDFINDPRGKAHDKVYSITNTLSHDFIDVTSGISHLVDAEVIAGE